MDQPASRGDFARLASHLFLTGGSGYVGRNLIRHLVAQGVEVTALARSARAADIVRAAGARPCHADLFDPGLADAMAGCRALIHAAADISHIRGTAEQQRVNVDGTAHVFAAARAAGIKRAIHISTESVLLDGRPLIAATERHPLPRRFPGAYSRSKAAAEQIALASNAPELAVIVLRPRFVWGRDDTTALPALTEAARSGKLAWIGGGTYLTSTTHIANLCAAVELALANGRGGEVYFISDGPPVSFRAFVSALLETQGLVPPAKSIPRPVVRAIATIGDLVGAVTGGRISSPLTRQSYATSAVEVSLNIGKAQRELAYVPVISREQGLEELRSAQH
ncbi:NAD-dependent epimerase/dehydratase family protein [Bosea sp. UC22_33]|uniref:NAD-dependent epimerase/dehydratase family protein n=1 Tax=Bosea sp. UC22_33 TaxID=3350165 RepID=UPI00366B9C0F